VSDIRFIASLRPSLPAGLYSVRVGQRLQSGALDAAFGVLAGAPDLQFDASGPRTELPPNSVAARFPVPGASVKLPGALPHIILSDPTLPWLRSPWAPADSDPSASWLALILLCGAEIDAVGRRSAKVGDLGRSLEPGERTEAMVNLVSLPADVAARVLPTPEDLPFLSHVRETSDTDASAHAVVICNRLPLSSARNEVHLVSLEDVPPPSPPSPSGAGGQQQGPAVELISLDHWQFDSVDDGSDFRELLLALAHNCGPLRQETGVAAADDQLRRGVVALRFHGTVAWYRGPLAPAGEDPAYRALGAAADDHLPARAEELLLFDEALQMVDATYAVAWDLGRALTLADGHAALAIDAYWRARRRWARTSGALQGMVDHRQAEPEASPDMVSWFESLFDLSAVPSRYLLPDADRLIPRTVARWESEGVKYSAPGRLGFFAVDPVWVTVMAFGAATLGLVTMEERKQLEGINLHGDPMWGFVLRSDLVRWDDLQIRVWAGPAATAKLLRTAQRDLGADLRLFLVQSDATSFTVELSRAPHGLHFGIDEMAAPMRKFPRGGPGATLKPVPVHERPGAPRTIAVSDLAAGLAVTDSAAFARQMVVGSPSLQFEIDLPARQ
jgi:hypothetical protein